MMENMSKPRVALMGLGIMGAGMAGRLLDAGFPLALYNRSRSKAEAFSGATVASSPREAAAHAEIIISMVADDAASRGVWLGPDGALAGAAKGSILIECSTLTVAWIRELAALAAKQGCELLDAPVTGTKPHAASGQLLFLVGGSQKALETARPVFAVMGRDAVHLGPVGSGALMKLANNFLAGVQAASLGEAMALIDAGGIDRDQALSILMNGAPGSPLIKTLWDRIKSGSQETNFMLQWMAKDLEYSAREGAEHGIAMKTATAALEVFRHAIAAGAGERDLSAVLVAGPERLPQSVKSPEPVQRRA